MSFNSKLGELLDAFDEQWYVERYIDVKEFGMPPKEHFLRFGLRMGRQPGPAYPHKYSLDEVFASSISHLTNDELAHETSRLQNEVDILEASGLIDDSYYLTSYPDVKAVGISPVWHYCQYGWKEMRNPSSKFNTQYYLSQNEDVKCSGINPLLHWCKYGRDEGRSINRAVVKRAVRKNNASPSIVFLCHEASQTGAPAVILSLMKFIKTHTRINFSIIIGEPGPWNSRFEALAPCFYINTPGHNDLIQEIKDFCGNYVQLVYVNTIASGHYLPLLDFLAAECITHVHEMDNIFRIFKDSFIECSKRCTKYIAVSPKSADAVRSRICAETSEIYILPPFIDPFTSDGEFIPSLYDGPVIFGCGTVEKRKGFDLFCEVAQSLLRRGVSNFRMFWIGAKGDLDPQDEIRRYDVGEHVVWLGSKDYPRKYFVQGDIFLLPSREDPFPLVGLEAAECCLPVVCFDQVAGGMVTFATPDAGFGVPYLDVEAMAEVVARLLADSELRKQLGRTAADKVKSRHYTSVVGHKIIDLFPTLVSQRGMTPMQAAQAFIDKASIVSFDIFDTLITRQVDEPEVVFDIIEYWLTVREASPVPFFQERMETAGQVLNSYNGTVEDVSIDEIYEHVPFFGNASMEKSIEQSICISRKFGIELYRYAVLHNKIIYLASDMYLDQNTIKSILSCSGVTHWDALLLSSSLGKKKDTGSLFPVLREKAALEGIPSEDIVHFGDNWNSDIRRAREAGLNAVHVTPIIEEYQPLFSLPTDAKTQLSQLGRIWDSFRAQAARLWQEDQPQLSNDFFIQTGFELSGPLAAMLAIYTHNIAKRFGANTICFLARDGRIVKKAFDSLYSKEIFDGTFVIHYLHLARATVVPASLEFPLSSNDLYFLVEGLHLAQKPVSYYLRKAGLSYDDHAVAAIVEQYFTSSEVIPDWRSRGSMLRMFSDLSGLIYSANQSKRLALRAYLEAHGLLTQDKILLVDVGWMLNIQSRLVKFIRSCGFEPDIIGCYIGSRERVDKSVCHFNLMFKYGEPALYSEFFEANTTLLEVLFSAPEPSSQSIKIDPDSGRPIVEFADLPTPLSNEFLVAQKLHMGAEAFFRILAKARETFFPDQISKDFFYHLVKALVETNDLRAKAWLTQFEIRLGGYHELVVRENLLQQDYIDYLFEPDAEYFEPLFFHVKADTPFFLIVTSAGLDNGSTRYRSLHLAQFLQHSQISCVVLHAATPEVTFRDIAAKAQAVIFQRCFLEQGNVELMFQCARALKLTCIADMDDLVFPEFIVTVGSVAGGEWTLADALFVATAYKKFLFMLDACIVSTPTLKSYCEENFALPTILIRNKIEERLMRFSPRRQPGSLRLLYASGTASHKEDFALIEDEIYTILCEHPGVWLSVLGSAQVSGRILALPNVSSYPLLPYDTMLEFISVHDLSLVPLVDNIFNHAKSAVKFLEAAAVGVATLASPLNEFTHVIRHRQNGLLAQPDCWKLELEWAIGNPGALLAIGQAAQRTLGRDYLVSQPDPEIIHLLRGAVLSRAWQSHSR
ncbi:glycosyltransferase [Fundidesulfovibrio agrisoli]|uniref:glycosyltransferase n=1 Tax=Fundidesulfovibrio agrisoli TaxID=2922717 RepID=UPI001FAB3C8A|nr:glycosyltransferase [Fundidesulfovibrio agrisoli]